MWNWATASEGTSCGGVFRACPWYNWDWASLDPERMHKSPKNSTASFLRNKLPVEVAAAENAEFFPFLSRFIFYVFVVMSHLWDWIWSPGSNLELGRCNFAKLKHLAFITLFCHLAKSLPLFKSKIEPWWQRRCQTSKAWSHDLQTTGANRYIWRTLVGESGGKNFLRV